MDFLRVKEKMLDRIDAERKGKGWDDIESWKEYYEVNEHKLNELKKDEAKNNHGIKQYLVDSELNAKVSIWTGDITKLRIDAIVNAANSSLLGGGGVDGAIHRSAGQYLLEECKTLKGCETGNAKITGGYNLPAKYVIHTVGPVYKKSTDAKSLLTSCYNRSLKLAVENKLRSIAFPCISTGVYGYPQEDAAIVAISTIREFLEKNSSLIDRVIFCLFLQEDVRIYETLMQLYFPIK